MDNSGLGETNRLARWASPSLGGVRGRALCDQLARGSGLVGSTIHAENSWIDVARLQRTWNAWVPVAIEWKFSNHDVEETHVLPPFQDGAMPKCKARASFMKHPVEDSLIEAWWAVSHYGIRHR